VSRRRSRRTVFIAVPLLLAGVALGSEAWWRCRPTTLVLVRHADRAGDQDALTPGGVRRAEELVQAPELGGVHAIFTSDTARARETAAPVARALGITPIERPASATGPLLEEVLQHHRGERVLVVGHSNTVPQLIRDAGGPTLPDIPHDEFDNIFVLTYCECWRPKAELSRSKYGAPSL
jgi:broad specificity phosphatase PhoE